MAGGVAGGPALAAKSWPRWLLFCLRLSLGIPALVHGKTDTRLQRYPGGTAAAYCITPFVGKIALQV